MNVASLWHCKEQTMYGVQNNFKKCLGMVYKRRKMSRYGEQKKKMSEVFGGVHAYRFRAHTQKMREILCAMASALTTFLVK